MKFYLYKIDEKFNEDNNKENNPLYFIIKNQLQFLYKEKQINEHALICDYFKTDNNPKIFVNDPNNLFFINWYEKKHVFFQTM